MVLVLTAVKISAKRFCVWVNVAERMVGPPEDETSGMLLRDFVIKLPSLPPCLSLVELQSSPVNSLPVVHKFHSYNKRLHCSLGRVRFSVFVLT